MAKSNIYLEERIPTPAQRTWLKFKEQHFALLALCLLLVFLFLSIVGPFITPYDPFKQNSETLLLPPSWYDGGKLSYFFGTDDLGRDLLSRLIYGTQLTLGTSVVIVVISASVGIFIGTLSGLTKGVKSSVLNHLLDLLQSIPSLLIAIIIVAVVGTGLTNAMWAISLALLPQFIHSTRDIVRKEMAKEYVTAARLDGANVFRLLSTSVFPNITEAMVLQITMALSIAVLDVTALGFLGLGAKPAQPEWGRMLSSGIELLYVSPWAVILPGVSIVLLVASINIVGDGLRRALKNRRER